MKDAAQLAPLVTGLAFALAFAMGWVANRVNFCTMGAVTDVVAFGDWRRMRMWLLAIAVAIAGTGALQAAGSIDVAKSLYTGAQVSWLSHVLGGLLFGFGMTLSSGCSNKTLIRIGGGNLKSLVVLIVLAITAYMTLKGAFAGFRAFGLDPVRFDVASLGAKTSDLPSIFGAPSGGARFVISLAIAAAIAVFVFANREFRGTREMIVGGIVIGAVIVGGWYVSGHLGFLAEDPATLEEKFVATNSGRMESFSFVSPAAYLLELLMLWTDSTRVLTFGIAGVLGMAAGSAAYALSSRTFRWEGFGGVEDIANHIVGAAMMGFGGVTALGCTIGQGLTGVSTLAIGSFVSLGAIIAGAVAATRYQSWRLDRMA